MARRKLQNRSRWVKGLRWLALLALALSVVAFGHGPAAQPTGTQSELRIGTPFFWSALECEAALRGLARRGAKAAPRVGTWNLRWFPRGTASGRNPERRTDVRWLACAIASLDVDVLAVQEVVQDPEGRAALLDMSARLDQLTAGRWRAELDECPGSGRQHVGLLYNARRVELRDAGAIAALNPGRSACDRSLRPGFAAHARFADGSDAHLVAVHLDSGMEARDFDNRRLSVERLRDVLPTLQQRHADPDVIVLGDFNTMGCGRCEPASSAAEELATFDALLDAVQLHRVSGAHGQLCSEYYRGHAGLLDHIVISRELGRSSPHAVVQSFGACAALACGAQPRGHPLAAFEHLSDHCPLVLELPAHAGASPRPARTARGTRATPAAPATPR